MATVKQFWLDPYQTRLTAQVSGVEGDWVQLDSTIFYAQSGGQESDTGRIAGAPVIKASKQGLDIHYQLPQGHCLKPGQEVEVEIDWVRRYRLMRLHFAAEIVLELTYRQLPGVEKVGAHIAEDKARIDFVWPSSLAAELPRITQDAEQLIAADLPITSAFSDPAAEKRYWAVEGFGQVACGGTHLRSTGEVGALKLKRKNPGSGKERIEITLVEP